MDSDVSSSKFWDNCYINHNTGWDLGSVTPVFKDWCDNKLQFAEAYEIANYIYYMASEKNSYMTGQTVSISGGE